MNIDLIFISFGGLQEAKRISYGLLSDFDDVATAGIAAHVVPTSPKSLFLINVIKKRKKRISDSLKCNRQNTFS